MKYANFDDFASKIGCHGIVAWAIAKKVGSINPSQTSIISENLLKTDFVLSAIICLESKEK